MLRAILFDLDDTLMPDKAAAEQAMVAAGRLAAEWHRVLPAELKDAVRRISRQRWNAHPVVAKYAGHFDVSSWSALGTRFEGKDDEMAQLRAWAPAYRHEVWTAALAEFGVADPLLADLLSCSYLEERRARYQLYPETLPLLEQLGREYRLGLVTNGPCDLQCDKIERTGLVGRFVCTLISRDVGVMKADPRIFQLALGQLAASPDEAVMVGDSLWHDVKGAHAAGIRAVWANYESRPAPNDVVPDLVIGSLAELPAALKQLG